MAANRWFALSQRNASLDSTTFTRLIVHPLFEKNFEQRTISTLFPFKKRTMLLSASLVVFIAHSMAFNLYAIRQISHFSDKQNGYTRLGLSNVSVASVSTCTMYHVG